MDSDVVTNKIDPVKRLTTDPEELLISEMLAADDQQSEPTTVKEFVKHWPKSTFCIISNEFCERFSFYGMRAVLTLYAINILRFNSADVVYLYHGFIVLCYTTPIFGSIIADGYIGKFWTIFSISILYAGGQLLLALSSIFQPSSSLHPTLDIIGLILIGLGTGGIKPCVAAFGGDQFPPHYVKMTSIFFSVFYFSINAGSTVSMFLTPILRAIPCQGQESCFPMAFGVPAALMILATLLFIAGAKHYKKFPPKENVIFRVLTITAQAIKNKTRSKLQRSHWLEHYLDTHHCEADRHCLALKSSSESQCNKCAQKVFIEYVKGLIRVIVMLLPVPVFWSLYDQQGSKWTLQALAMNCKITESFTILPDQMGILNAILILVCIPVFQFGIYPAIEKLRIETKPLRRMAAGGFLASIAFVICALVQTKINETLPINPTYDTAFVSFINAHTNCSIRIHHPGMSDKVLQPNTSLVDKAVIGQIERYKLKVGYASETKFDIVYEEACYGRNITATLQLEGNFSWQNLEGGRVYYAIVSDVGVIYEEALYQKPKKGRGESNLNINMMVPCSLASTKKYVPDCALSQPSHAYAGDVALCRIQKSDHSVCDFSNEEETVIWSGLSARSKDPSPSDTAGSSFVASVYNYRDIQPGRYRVYFIKRSVDNNSSSARYKTVEAKNVEDVVVDIAGMGGVYSLTLFSNTEAGNSNISVIQAHLYTIVPENYISIMWQIPQYILITCAEVLISMTGIEFAYSQAAPVLKSVVQAIWLFTVAVGDIIIIIIERLHLFDNLALEMIAYSGVMLVVIIIFSLMAVFFYEYADYADEKCEANNSNSLKAKVLLSDGDGSFDTKLNRST